MPSRFRIAYVDTSSLADLIERYHAASLRARELRSDRQRFGIKRLRLRCSEVVKRMQRLADRTGLPVAGAASL